jgi:O-6-methylguanine DNA methyltransferase
MTEHAFTLFDTAIGRCGIAWSGRGIACVQLPEADEASTRARILKRCPDAREALPPPGVARAIDGIAALMRGEAIDLSAVALDMDGVPPFYRRVYEAARTIAPGATLTYGEIAARLGDPAAARAVGQALGQNPFAIVVPCHRVVAAGHRPGGFSAHGGVASKQRLLAIEGTPASAEPTLFDRGGGLRFHPGPVSRDRRRDEPAAQASSKQHPTSSR